MIRLAVGLVLVVFTGAAHLASAQDFTTQDPRYTTTPPQYTTTPARYTTTPPQYTTTPPQYTTTPAAYVPQADTVPSTDPTTPTIPRNRSGTGNSLLQNGQLTGTDLSGTDLSNTDLSSLVIQQAGASTPSGTSLRMQVPTGDEPLVEMFAQSLLQLDDEQTEQFIGDYYRVVLSLGLDPSEVSVGAKFTIVLYLTVSRWLGLSI